MSYHLILTFLIILTIAACSIKHPEIISIKNVELLDDNEEQLMISSTLNC